MITETHRTTIVERVQSSIDVREELLTSDAVDAAARAAAAMIEAFRQGKAAYFFGNGGSSMDAGHLAAELLGRYYFDRKPLASVALGDNTAAMTAIGNDYSYEETFSRQILGLGRAGDVAIGMTTSGNSPNVVRALKTARSIDMVTIVFTGGNGGAVVEHADHCIRIPTADTPRIQECQMLLGHTICEIIEAQLFSIVL